VSAGIVLWDLFSKIRFEKWDLRSEKKVERVEWIFILSSKK
jgi:hypothetical protein